MWRLNLERQTPYGVVLRVDFPPCVLITSSTCQASLLKCRRYMASSPYILLNPGPLQKTSQKRYMASVSREDADATWHRVT